MSQLLTLDTQQLVNDSFDNKENTAPGQYVKTTKSCSSGLIHGSHYVICMGQHFLLFCVYKFNFVDFQAGLGGRLPTTTTTSGRSKRMRCLQTRLVATTSPLAFGRTGPNTKISSQRLDTNAVIQFLWTIIF